MKKTFWIILAACVAAVCAPGAHAQITTYQITFTNSTPADGPTPAYGRFVYDYTTNQFLSFTVQWDGLTFDLTASANSPTIETGGPACLSGATGPQATLALLTICNATYPATHWFGNNPIKFLRVPANFDFQSVQFPLPTTDQINVFDHLPDTGTGAAASGSFLVTPVSPWPHVVGLGFDQIIREIAGPVMVPPGVPVEVSLGFVDVNGNAIGTNSTVTLTSGQSAILDLSADSLLQQVGQRVLVRPVVSVLNVGVPVGAAAVAPPAVTLPEVTQVFDRLTGFGTVLVPGEPGFAANPVFDLQGLAGGQTMQLNVTAFPPDPCIGTISFVGRDGNPLGTSMQVNAQPGQTVSLNLNAAALGLQLGQRREVLPIFSAAPFTAAGPPVNSACQASVEVFDNATGRTATHQSGAKELPAVQ